MKTLYLRKNEERRLRAGHLWIFSNEVDTARSPLKEFEPGECARVVTSHGSPVACAYVNPASLISGRIVSRDAGRALDADLLRARIAEALALRERLYDAPYYRLVFSEGDYLPGLIVDRYGDVLCVQLSTAGMERVKATVAGVLRDLLRPRGILFKNDVSVRELEGLELYTETVDEVPDAVEVVENGARFTVPLAGGQKTGWFYDMRDNRAAFARYAGGAAGANGATGPTGADVLDIFSYAGGLGIAALAAGARSATCIDSSAPALEAARASAALNDVADGLETVQGDAFEEMAALRDEGRQFEAVSLDPPAFIKRKKDAKQGEAAYLKANRLALSLVANGGVFMTCSCSQHLDADTLRKTLLHAAGDAGVRLRILERRSQGRDHPVHPAMPETEYLKGFIAMVHRAK